ncbi:thiol-disulfide oxidoreductase DCC family protein [Roseateles sp. DC23W]|uniref:Thiol-disulfide oxidoreductase DCC family protein n=1 Tax=Pelomonas dachongensis TaxID=3299029 RepID=A0ABW7EN59_9BURK
MTTSPAQIHTVYYDGVCPLCRSEMGVLMRNNDTGLLRFVDISRPDFDAAALGVTQAALMARLHVQAPDGTWLIGVPAVRAAYAATGHHRVAALLAVPLLARLAEPAYAWLADHRYRLPHWLLKAARLHASSCAPQGSCHAR